MIVELRSTETGYVHKLKFQNQDLTLKPGKSTMVNFEQAAFWLGDPGTLEGRRRDEYDRKRTYWGFALGFNTDADWEAMRPKLEVYNQDGQRIFMVLDDPDGSQSNPVTSASDISTLAVNDQIAVLQQQIAALTAAIQAGQAGPSSSVSVNDLGDGGKPADAGHVPKADPSTAGAKPDSPKAPRQS